MVHCLNLISPSETPLKVHPTFCVHGGFKNPVVLSSSTVGKIQLMLILQYTHNFLFHFHSLVQEIIELFLFLQLFRCRSWSHRVEHFFLK